MRMRRKRNLDTFIASYPDLLTVPERTDKNVQKALEHKEYIDFKTLFNVDSIELEIGCGKGAFICELAKRNPNKGFVAVEVSKNVIVEGCKKAREENLTNVHFLNCPAELLPCYLEENSVDRIYLNFSCPYPKYTYASHRLTNPRFLLSYLSYLKKDGEIHQKTDNMHFFEYSLEQYSSCGYGIKNISLDLHASDFEGNIVTEYEKKFSDMGMPIYRAEAYIKAEK